MTKLTLGDISDLRAYEREREAFRREVVALKRRRRVALGDLVSVVFENRRTVRFQVQEMARAERLITDEAIEAELQAYNPLVPDPGELCATLFVELTSREAVVAWLPRLVGLESTVGLRLADGEVVPAAVDRAHAQRLTGGGTTASVHYVRWRMTPVQVDRFAAGGASLTAGHEHYRAAAPLPDETVAELVGDLRHGG
jgi:Protein of unknown function (DUF3501)